MSLVEFQKTLKTLWLSPQGMEAMASEEAYAHFIQQSRLTDIEKTMMLGHPFERVKQYQYMVLGNIQDTLESIYPYTQQILGEQWNEWVKSYIGEHPPSSYLLSKLAETFPSFLAKQATIVANYPFLPDLARYEWQEAELLNALDETLPQKLKAKPDIDLQTHAPVLNPIASIFQSPWNIPQLVQQLEDKRPIQPQESSQPIWMLRLPEYPFSVSFHEVSPLLAVWLQFVFNMGQEAWSVSYQDTLEALTNWLQQSQPNISLATVQTEFENAFSNLLDSKIILGSLAT